MSRFHPHVRKFILTFAFLPLILVMTISLSGMSLAYAASDPPCAANVRLPRTTGQQCAETVIKDLDAQGIMSISAMTFGPDGSLYFARPATREIWRLKPDANGFIVAPYPEPQIFASDLPEPPIGITYADGAWYVSGDTSIIRLKDTDNDGKADDQKVIVSDLPGGVGGWLSNLHIGPDHRLYVAKAASCDACAEIDNRRAALLSFALDGGDKDGTDMKIVATGLHDSYDFDWNNGTLYIVDSISGQPAELNVIDQSSNVIPDFGWPKCDAKSPPIGSAVDSECATSAKPVATFPIDSHPMGTILYKAQQLKGMPPVNTLLVVLSGASTVEGIVGHTVVAIPIDEDGMVGKVRQFIPDPSNTRPNPSDSSLYLLTFYPTHPVAIAADKAGWLYISTSEGSILRIRPRP